MAVRIPANILDAFEISDLAAGSTVIAFWSPTGGSGTRLSGHALHAQHHAPSQRRSARARLAHTRQRFEARIGEIRAVVATFCDTSGRIVHPDEFAAALTAEPNPTASSERDAYQVVLRSLDGESGYVFETTGTLDHAELRRDQLARDFADWIHHDQTRAAGAGA